MKSLLRLAKKPALRVAGLMSGTSCDGVDAAIVDVGPRRRWSVVACGTYPYPASLRRRVFALFSADTARVDEICRLNFSLGEVFAGAVLRLAGECGVQVGTIDLIGSHGQTIHHLPPGRRRPGSTLQIAEPCVIAERTGITTVADFRCRDVAAGGQGAPLVAYADYFLLAHRRKSRAVQNIGGIANVTYLPAGCALGDVRAFDTGPGNMIIDHTASLATGGRKRFDAGGRLAAAGRVLPDLLAGLMKHPFLRKPPPKSTGREEFGRGLAEKLFRRAVDGGGAPSDAVATATAFTARSIARAYRRFGPGEIDEVIVCGGGARNPVLMDMLAKAMGGANVVLIDELGISADAKEAISFAVLACRTVRGAAGNVPSATGAGRAVVLGKIVPGRGRRGR